MELTELDHQIVRTAEKHFLSEGIMNTDMKKLASELGISRSTLYRHFPSSFAISFYVVKDYLVFFMSDDESLYKDKDGYTAFSLYVRRFLDKLCANLDFVRVISEFDALHTPKHGAVPPQDFSVFIRNESQQPCTILFNRGLEDGSIVSDAEGINPGLTFVFAALSLVTHIMLREEIYIEEHGAAREYVDYAIDLMLSAIKA